MSTLTPVLVTLLSNDIKKSARRARRIAIAFAMAALFGVLALASLCVAAGIYLSRTRDPGEAALIVAIALIAISLLILAMTAGYSAYERRGQSRHSAGAVLAATAAVTLIPMLVRSRALSSLATAAIAGFTLVNLASRQSSKPRDRPSTSVKSRS